MFLLHAISSFQRLTFLPLLSILLILHLFPHRSTASSNLPEGHWDRTTGTYITPLCRVYMHQHRDQYGTIHVAVVAPATLGSRPLMINGFWRYYRLANGPVTILCPELEFGNVTIERGNPDNPKETRLVMRYGKDVWDTWDRVRCWRNKWQWADKEDLIGGGYWRKVKCVFDCKLPAMG
jgi:hypothetical protein